MTAAMPPTTLDLRASAQKAETLSGQALLSAFARLADGLPELTKRFRVYYKKVDGQTPTSYTMDHSAGSYVYDATGRVRLYHRYGSGAQALADDVKRLLNE